MSFVLLSLHILCTPRRLAEQTTEIKRTLTALIQKLNAESWPLTACAQRIVGHASACPAGPARPNGVSTEYIVARCASSSC
jgi:hypothetical protein